MMTRMNRRRFLAGAAAGGAGLLILPNAASARSYRAGEKLNIALVGVGSRGKHFLRAVPHIGENLVALCDVNQQQTDGPAKDLPAARQFRDFRKMFDAMERQYAPVAATNFVTLLAPTFVTQMLTPSKAMPYGLLPV